MRTVQKLLCLSVAGVCTFAACLSRAAIWNVDWESGIGFDPDAITINAGDEVDFYNYDSSYDLYLTGNPPESFSGDVPYSGYEGYLWFSSWIYSTPGTYTAYDQYDDYIYITVNSGVVTPLSVTITSPANNSVFVVPATFGVTATPAGGSGSYNDVEFLVGTNEVADVTSPPFSTTVNKLAEGSYVITAIVTDSDNNTATNSIDVTVGPPIVTNNILPFACADIYSSGNVDYGLYLDADQYDHGTLEFAAFNASQYTSILLEVNPYALPLIGPVVSVYGFDGGNGTLYSSNYNSGTLIGQWTLPSGLGYGQVATFDVTSFVKSTKGPYFGIALAGGGDTFSSTSINYGTPPMLYAVGPPLVSAARAGNQLIINWATNTPPTLSLEASTNLGPNAAWNPVVQTPAVVGTQWAVTNPMTGPSAFFRLSSQ